MPDLPIPDQRDHGALARPYAHVTAPLRRLVDRYGTEVCLAHCAGVPVPQWVHEALPTLGEAMTAGVRTGAAVDRECVDAVEAAVLAPHVGEVFDAVGLDDRTVQLADPAVVARCTGAVKVGERQQVRLVAADAAGAQFAVAEEGRLGRGWPPVVARREPPGERGGEGHRLAVARAAADLEHRLAGRERHP